jgi:hypothetical protein
MAKAKRNSSTAAQLTIETPSGTWYLEPLAAGESEIRRRARQWRTARILRFIDRQKKQRAWIAFGELAECYGRNIGIAEGYEQLKRAVINGEFERNGRSRVLYLHPGVTRAKMTREWMRNAAETFPAETVRRAYLAPCWIPRELADAWWANHGPQTPNKAETALPSDQAANRKGGRDENDDTDALDEMHRLLVQREGLSVRKAATQVVAQGLAHGTGTVESTISRVRKKFPAFKRSRR